MPAVDVTDSIVGVSSNSVNNTTGHVHPGVSFFYGRGVFICWLLTVASVYVRWMYNVRYRRTMVTADLMVALLFPSIAAVHLFYRVLQGYNIDLNAKTSPTEDGMVYFPSTEIVEAAVATEPPLAVCQCFAFAALLLLPAAKDRRRVSALCSVWALIITPEILLYTSGFGSALFVGETDICLKDLSFKFWGEIIAPLIFNLITILAIEGLVRAHEPPKARGRMQETSFKVVPTWAAVLSFVRVWFVVAALQHRTIGYSRELYRMLLPEITRPWVSLNSASIRGLDQIVAAAIGAIMLLISISNAIAAWKMTALDPTHGPDE